MRHALRTEIVIAASAERVWSLLTDFARYPEWNPFVRTLAGKLEIGERLEVELAPPDGKPMRFTPRIVELEAGRLFAWHGRLFLPGLFDGEHRFELEPADGGGVRFVHSERFRGVLVPLLRKTLDEKTRAGFEAMNRALKERAEASSGPPV